MPVRPTPVEKAAQGALLFVHRRTKGMPKPMRTVLCGRRRIHVAERSEEFLEVPQVDEIRLELLWVDRVFDRGEPLRAELVDLRAWIRR
jgi:hypothetical protein